MADNDGPRRVALLMDAASAYTRSVLRGVYRFIIPNRPWAIRRLDYNPRSLSILERWQPCGIIALLETPQAADRVLGLGKHLVDVAGAIGDPQWPQVRADDIAVGRMAGEYLLGKGLRSLAFFANQRADWVVRRKKGFCDYLNRHGIVPLILDVDSRRPSDETKILKWLTLLPKPAGVFACDDAGAFELAEFCRLAALGVPHQVSLLGVDNDRLLCNLGFPPLSSVQMPIVEIGFRAATLLEALMSGGRRPLKHLELKPVGVFSRQSTDTVAVGDPQAAQALRYIRDHIKQPIGVADILLEMSVSRRSLEQRVRKSLGHTILTEINLVRIEKAKPLLAETDLKLTQIAKNVGFASAQQLCRVFRRAINMTPGHFRRQCKHL